MSYRSMTPDQMGARMALLERLCEKVARAIERYEPDPDSVWTELHSELWHAGFDLKGEKLEQEKRRRRKRESPFPEMMTPEERKQAKEYADWLTEMMVERVRRACKHGVGPAPCPFPSREFLAHPCGTCYPDGYHERGGYE